MALPNPRYERKFIAEGYTLAGALALVRSQRSGFHEAYPPRTINNIYLDSPSRCAYHDHLNGAPQRVKHRVRWYGAFAGNIAQPLLERKFKSGSISGKDSYVLPGFELNGQPVRSSLATLLDVPALPDRLRAELRLLQPCLMNQYRRNYFVSADGRFRLTVDSDFRFGNALGHGARLNPAGQRAPSVVLELKFEVQHALDAECITNALPLRMARCSKFILGLQNL